MPDPDSLKRGAQAGALVTQMAVSTVVGAGLGRWLDARFDTEPWLMVLGLFGGFASGLTVLFTGITRLQREDDDEPPDPAQ